jgi:putative acetyltransferase
MRQTGVHRDPQSSDALTVRPARFEDVPDVLRLVQRAIEAGCRPQYRPEQRRAVFLSYAQSLFVEVLAPFETVIAQRRRRMVGLCQLDLGAGRLRALFIDADFQGGGHGRELLDWAEGRASAARLRRLHGAMSLNAVPFYASAGYQPCAGNQWLRHMGIAVPVLPMEKFLPAPDSGS